MHIYKTTLQLHHVCRIGVWGVRVWQAWFPCPQFNIAMAFWNPLSPPSFHSFLLCNNSDPPLAIYLAQTFIWIARPSLRSKPELLRHPTSEKVHLAIKWRPEVGLLFWVGSERGRGRGRVGKRAALFIWCDLVRVNPLASRTDVLTEC